MPSSWKYDAGFCTGLLAALRFQDWLQLCVRLQLPLSLSLPRSHIKPSLSCSILSFLLCWTRMQFAEGSRLWLVAIHKIVIGAGVDWEEGARGALATDQGTEMRTVGLTQQSWWLSRIKSWTKNIGKGQEPEAYLWHAYNKADQNNKGFRRGSCFHHTHKHKYITASWTHKSDLTVEPAVFLNKRRSFMQ